MYISYISVLTPHLFSLPIHDSFFRDHQRIRGMRNFSIQRLYPYKPFGFNQTLNFSFRELRIKGDSVSLNLFFNSKFFETPSFLILKNSGSALHSFQPWPDACLLFRLSNSSYDWWIDPQRWLEYLIYLLPGGRILSTLPSGLHSDVRTLLCTPGTSFWCVRTRH